MLYHSYSKYKIVCTFCGNLNDKEKCFETPPKIIRTHLASIKNKVLALYFRNHYLSIIYSCKSTFYCDLPKD